MVGGRTQCASRNPRSIGAIVGQLSTPIGQLALYPFARFPSCRGVPKTEANHDRPSTSVRRAGRPSPRGAPGGCARGASSARGSRAAGGRGAADALARGDREGVPRVRGARGARPGRDGRRLQGAAEEPRPRSSRSRCCPPEVGARARASPSASSARRRTLARLHHPHIVGVHDFGETDGLYYLVMEFVDGAEPARR